MTYLPNAKDVNVDKSAFNGTLSAVTPNVQAMLYAVDQGAGGGGGSGIGGVRLRQTALAGGALQRLAAGVQPTDVVQLSADLLLSFSDGTGRTLPALTEWPAPTVSATNYALVEYAGSVFTPLHTLIPQNTSDTEPTDALNAATEATQENFTTYTAPNGDTISVDSEYGSAYGWYTNDGDGGYNYWENNNINTGTWVYAFNTPTFVNSFTLDARAWDGFSAETNVDLIQLYGNSGSGFVLIDSYSPSGPGVYTFTFSSGNSKVYNSLQVIISKSSGYYHMRMYTAVANTQTMKSGYYWFNPNLMEMRKLTGTVSSYSWTVVKALFLGYCVVDGSAIITNVTTYPYKIDYASNPSSLADSSKSIKASDLMFNGCTFSGITTDAKTGSDAAGSSSILHPGNSSILIKVGTSAVETFAIADWRINTTVIGTGAVSGTGGVVTKVVHLQDNLFAAYTGYYTYTFTVDTAGAVTILNNITPSIGTTFLFDRISATQILLFGSTYAQTYTVDAAGTMTLNSQLTTSALNWTAAFVLRVSEGTLLHVNLYGGTFISTPIYISSAGVLSLGQFTSSITSITWSGATINATNVAMTRAGLVLYGTSSNGGVYTDVLLLFGVDKLTGFVSSILNTYGFNTDLIGSAYMFGCGSDSIALMKPHTTTSTMYLCTVRVDADAGAFDASRTTRYTLGSSSAYLMSHEPSRLADGYFLYYTYNYLLATPLAMNMINLTESSRVSYPAALYRTMGRQISEDKVASGSRSAAVALPRLPMLTPGGNANLVAARASLDRSYVWPLNTTLNEANSGPAFTATGTATFVGRSYAAATALYVLDTAYTNYISTGAQSALGVGTGDFCFELSFCTGEISTVDNRSIAVLVDAGSKYLYLGMDNNTPRNLTFRTNVSGLASYDSSGLINADINRLVLQRRGSTLSIYLNGTRLNTQTYTATHGATFNIILGGSTVAGNFSAPKLNSYENVRFTRAALYTSPTITYPLTAISTDPFAGDDMQIYAGSTLHTGMTDRVNTPEVSMQRLTGLRSRYAYMNKNAAYAVLPSDFGKLIRHTDTTSRTYTLPAVNTADIGSTIAFTNQTTTVGGSVIVRAPTGVIIGTSTAAGTATCAGNQLNSILVLMLVSETMWAVVGSAGTWTYA